MRRRLLLVSLLIFGVVVSAQAQTTQSANPMLDQMKHIANLLGVHLSSDVLLPSLEALERTVFGRAMEGTLIQRINQLQTFVLGDGYAASLIYNLNMIEWMVYGEIQGGNATERMYRLERDILGQTTSGSSLAERSAVLFGAIMPTGVLPVEKVTVTTGVPVLFSVMEQVASDAKPGTVTVVRAKVIEDVIIDDVLIIPKGTLFDLRVTQVQAASRAGIPAEISLSPRNLYTVSGQPLRVEMREALTGGDRTATTVGASLLGAVMLGPVGLLGGLLVEGEDIVIGVHDVLTAQIAADQVLYGYPLFRHEIS